MESQQHHHQQQPQKCRKRTAAEVDDDDTTNNNKMEYFGTGAVSWCFPFRVEGGGGGSLSHHSKNNIHKLSSKKFHGSDNADALLAKEMNSLSLVERERVFEDIHAVPRQFEETPESVEKALLQMMGFNKPDNESVLRMRTPPRTRQLLRLGDACEGISFYICD